MTNKTTKRALIMSVLSLFLCFSMLIGTTFAWFTDEVKSGTNKIVAGNLDVELYNELADKIADTNKVSESTKLFRLSDDQLWEPGAVVYENFTVVNEGNLALKYSLGVNIGNAKGDKNLADVLKVGVVADGINATTRDAAIAAVTEWQDFESFAEEGKLYAEDGKDTATYGIVIWWEPSDKDDDYNMNNENQGKQLTIDVGVTLFATQLDYEKDSFGNDYDEGLVPGATYVNDVASLIKAIAEGGTIALGNDLTISASDFVNDPAIAPLPVGLAILKDTVIDLNGCDLVFEDTGAGTTNAAIFAHDADLVIKGEGNITQQGTDDYLLWAKGESKVDIYSGNFVTAPDDCSVLYASGNVSYSAADPYATINVYGGNFTSGNLAESQDCANVMNHGVGKINYYGGVYNWNPTGEGMNWDYNWSDDMAHIKVADGYKVVEKNGLYYVIPDNATLAGSSADLKAAIAAGAKEVVVVDAVLTEKLSLGSDVNASFVGCEISGNNSWGYINNATFEGCTFDSGADNAAIHFDRLYGELVVKDCTFKSGKVQIGTDGDSSATFINCEFAETATTSIWAEKGMRFYCPTTFVNCEFNNRVVLAGSNDLPLVFEGCTMNDGEPVYYVDNTDGIIRGGNIPAVTIK